MMHSVCVSCGWITRGVSESVYVGSPCDYVSVRSWLLFRARALMLLLNESSLPRMRELNDTNGLSFRIFKNGEIELISNYLCFHK